ncbi:hypothetical protein BG015_006144, partial [Linnemannia schmuckeri]
MKRKLDGNTERPEKLEDLWERVQKIWADFLHKLYESMPKRLEEVNNHKGDNT